MSEIQRPLRKRLLRRYAKLLSTVVVILLTTSCGRTVEVLLTCPSPDGEIKAIFYWVYGGGAAGWAFFRLAIEPSDKELDPDRFLFEMAHGYDVRLTWDRDGHLLVEYPDKAVVRKQLDVFERQGNIAEQSKAIVRLKYTPVATAQEGSLASGSQCQ